MPPKPVSKLEQKAPSGNDKFLFKNGSKYEGEYVSNNGIILKHGKGKYIESLHQLDPHDCPGIEPDEINADINQVYEGIFNMDQFEEGKVTYADNSFYEGKFDSDGNYSEGKYTFADGSQWIGPFKFCKMNGEGIFIDKAGRKWRGVMEDNQCDAMIEVI
ncbi:Conserved_hypothetical protein [Hexamita inflata]|uniref:Uncharacterized protein n=1 Tax=Hexamita inflata TaxID=28002 RepID=A0AA86U8W8_9EUKA|nr:Conserved hypothetical protein [Hexamita inflata]CAI9970739.1 Conserved hypothetical protein [Hexamita inflata]